VHDFGTWRRNSAHELRYAQGHGHAWARPSSHVYAIQIHLLAPLPLHRYMDGLSQTTLAAQVCGASKAIVQSSMQSDVYENIVSYLGTEKIQPHSFAFNPGGFLLVRLLNYSPGVSLAMAAIALWSFTIFCELIETASALDAMLHLQTGNLEETRRLSRPDGHGNLIIRRVMLYEKVHRSKLPLLCFRCAPSRPPSPRKYRPISSRLASGTHHIAAARPIDHRRPPLHPWLRIPRSHARNMRAQCANFDRSVIEPCAGAAVLMSHVRSSARAVLNAVALE
jgi:hypothetical protein